MARVLNGHPTKRATVTINGLIKPITPLGVVFTIRNDGVERSWQLASGSPHLAAYAAAITAMGDADAAGVTHLTLQTPANLVRRQATGEWNVDSPDLKRAHLLYELFKIDFDDVDWIKGPG